MKMNKKTMSLAALLLVLVLITTCFAGTTLAKYISSATGADIATVAKWSFTVNGTELAVQPAAALTFDLFETINDTGNATDETDVAAGKIAPGTAGSFDLEIENASDVNAKWTVTLAETNANIPLQYSVDGNTWVDSVAELTMTDLTNNDIGMGTKETVTVYWQWVYENGHAGQTDDTDTELGIYARNDATVPSVTITATLTATQVD